MVKRPLGIFLTSLSRFASASIIGCEVKPLQATLILWGEKRTGIGQLFAIRMLKKLFFLVSQKTVKK
jgi:hypothetical protein